MSDNPKSTDEIWQQRISDAVINARKTEISAADIYGKEFPPIKWVIPDILPEGVFWLAGSPKIGKSWLAMSISLAVASGGLVFGDREVEPGDVLHFALEDNQRRLQSRMKMLLPEGQTPSDRLRFNTEALRADYGLIDYMGEWIGDVITPRLIVVDTYLKIQSGIDSPSASQYQIDYERLDPLVKFANANSITLLLVHHLRKTESDDALNMVSGSVGMTAAVDGVLTLTRERGQDAGYFFVTGRDVQEEKYAMTLQDGCNWQLEGKAEEYALNEKQRNIQDVLRDGSSKSLKELCDALDLEYGKNKGNVRRTVLKMLDDGLLDRQGSRYRLHRAEHREYPGSNSVTH